MSNDRREFLKAASVLALSTTLGGLSVPAAAAAESKPAMPTLGVRGSGGAFFDQGGVLLGAAVHARDCLVDVRKVFGL